VSGCAHDWLLLGPSYRWQRDGVPPRETMPAIQKYDTSQLVDLYLKDPRHSRSYEPEDEVYVTAPASGTRLLSPLKLVSTGTRKLFLPVHKRFYLVAVELCCDRPGLPSPGHGQACEAGFVVRRRRLEFPRSARRDAHRLLQRLAAGGARARGGSPVRVGAVAKGGSGPRLRMAPEPQAALELQEAQAELLAWVDEVGAVTTLEGWVPEGDRLGAWQEVAEEPQEIEEAVFPLTPLVPDPSLPEHPGQRRAIWFGMLPTSTADSDASGTPRFDDATLYELRCFVRRHDDRCPKMVEPGDCKGELVWSRPSADYRLAPQNDPVGTSNTAVTVDLPDVPALLATAAGSGPRPRGGGLRLNAPAGSSVAVQPDGVSPPTSATLRGPGFCSFSIPLITIVATFVLQLFLPIVLFVFQLWVLLMLRFCIPPSVSLSAGLAAELKTAGELGLDLDVDGSVNFTPAQLRAKLSADFDTMFGAGVGAQLTAEGSGTMDLSNASLATFATTVTADNADVVEPGGELALTAGLHWEDET
jgi:hypothetical protein